MRREGVFVTALLGAVAATACSGAGSTDEGGTTADKTALNEGYPTPRYPRWIADPSDEQMLGAARDAVRQTYGFSALGKIKDGETVHIFMDTRQDMSVFDAIKAAYAERGVTAVPIQPWEVMGLSPEEYKKVADPTFERGNEAWKELGHFDPKYMAYLPKDVQERMLPLPIRLSDYLKPYMDKHPEIERIFYAPGGLNYGWDPYVGPGHKDKFVGNWMYRQKSELLNKSSVFPAAVWSMVEEHIVKPIEHVSEGTMKDPEGTDVHFEITPVQALQWRSFVDLANNHIFAYPNSWQTEKMEGRIRACSNHTGFYPCMTVYLSKRGRVERIEGGGKTGDYFRMLVEHPDLKDVQFPEAPEPGYWWFSPDGLATNPKKVRDYPFLVDGSLMPNGVERERAGVMHFSFASPAGFFGQSIDPERTAAALQRLTVILRQGKPPIISGDTSATDFAVDPRDVQYAVDRDIPIGHTSHMHNYFLTIKWKLRDTGEWITIADKGMITALQDPEVRALASKYGDPDKITQYDWVPEVPGINVPGDHERDYATDPWSYIVAVWGHIRDGSYKYYLEDYSTERATA